LDAKLTGKKDGCASVPPRLEVRGVPETILPGQPWTMIRLPVETITLFQSKARVSVRVLIGGEVFATSIFPTGDGLHQVMFNKAMQKAAAKIGWQPGEELAFAVEKDDAPRPEAAMPSALESALEMNAQAKSLFEKLAPSHRKEFVRYVSEAKQAATRERRASRCVEMIIQKLKPDF